MRLCLQCARRRVVTPIKWRWALLMALASAWMAGCAAVPYPAALAERHAAVVPCDKDNCGKSVR